MLPLALGVGVSSGGGIFFFFFFFFFFSFPFIFRGNQDVGSFNDAYSAIGTKKSIMFMPGACNRMPKSRS